MQVVGPRVDPGVTDPSDRQTLLSAAEDAASSGFVTALGGLQGRWGRTTAFVQYQVTSSPSDDKLLKGASAIFSSAAYGSALAARAGYVTAGGY